MRRLFLFLVGSFAAFAQQSTSLDIRVRAKKDPAIENLKPGISMGLDTGQSLERAVGFRKARKGAIANDIVLRGFQKQNINVFYDDIEIHGACPNRMDPPAFKVDISNVESVEVIRGPFDVRFQGSLGGVVNFKTKTPKEGLDLELNLSAGSFDFRSASLRASFRSKDFFVQLSTSHKRAEPYKDGSGVRLTEIYPPSDVAGYRPEASKGRAYEVNFTSLKTKFSPLKGQNLELFASRQESTQVLYPALLMDGISDTANAIKLGYTLEDILFFDSLKLTFSYSETQHDMTDQLRRRAAVNPIPGRPYHMRSYAESRNVALRADMNLDNFLFGFETYRWNWDATNERRGYRGGLPVPIIPDVDTENIGLFGQYSKDFNKIRLLAGLRLDSVKTKAKNLPLPNPASDRSSVSDLYFTYHLSRELSRTDTYPSGNIQLFYDFGENLELSAKIGHGVRVPDAQERYFVLPMPIMGGQCRNPENVPDWCAWVGNPELKPSKNTQIELGVKYTKDNTALNARAFVSFVEDYITLGTVRARTLTPFNMGVANARAMSYVNTGATLTGFEIGFNTKLPAGFDLELGVDFVSGKKSKKPEFGLNDSDLAEIPPLRGVLSIGYKKSGAYFRVDTIASASQNRVDSDLRESKTPGWTTVNLTAGYSAKFGDLRVDVNNVFDRKYFEYLSYVRNPFRAGVSVPEPGRSITLSANFSF
ncbi:MAG: TonB-dependent receptor [Aquificaceae bacterium]